MTAANAVCITLDVDWAPEEGLASVADALRRFGLKATFFATHLSDVLGRLAGDQFEIGLQPHFKDCGEDCGDDCARAVAELEQAHPAAEGGRSHPLPMSSQILRLHTEHGLSYESNALLPGHAGLHPVERFKGFASIPFNWSDDKHLEMGRAFQVSELRLADPGLKVLNYHSVHLFVNTSSAAHYEAYDPYYRDGARVGSHVNRTTPGIGTLFGYSVARLAEEEVGPRTLREIRDDYLRATRCVP